MLLNHEGPVTTLQPFSHEGRCKLHAWPWAHAPMRPWAHAPPCITQQSFHACSESRTQHLIPEQHECCSGTTLSSQDVTCTETHQKRDLIFGDLTDLKLERLTWPCLCVPCAA